MYEMFLAFVKKGLGGRNYNLSDDEVTDDALVVLFVKGIKDGVGESVVRHGDAVQRTDDVFSGLPVMMVEGFGAGHVAEGQK